MRKLGLCLLSFMLVVVIYSQDADGGLSLSQAIKNAIENSNESKNAQLDLEIADKKVLETISTGLPQISSNVSYQNYIQQPVQLVPANFQGGNSGEYIPVVFGLKQNVSANITVSQLVFDGSYLVGLKSAKLYRRISKVQSQKTGLETTKSVIEAYVNTLLAEENQKIAENNLKVIDTMFIQTKKLFEMGFLEEEQVDQMNISKLSLETILESASSMKEITRKILNLSMGMNLDEQAELTDSIEEILTKSLVEDQSYYNFNIKDNLDYKIALGNRDSKIAFKKLENSYKIPTINASLSGFYNAFSNQFTFFERSQDWFPSAFLGVSINIPIFSSFKSYARIKQANLEVLKSENILKNTEQRVLLQLEQSKSNYRQSVSEYNASKKSLVLAERIFYKNQIKYGQGTVGSLDLKEVQKQLYSSQGQYLQSMQRVIFNKLKLDNILNKSNFNR